MTDLETKPLEDNVAKSDVEEEHKSDNAILNETPNKSLMNLIQESFNNPIIKGELLKTNIEISPQMKTIIERIIASNPNVFPDLEKAVQEIIKDNKIDSKDIPQLIVIVRMLYQLLSGFKDMKLNTNNTIILVSNVLKYLIHLMVLNDVIHINNKPEFFKEVDLLVDSCVGLLGFAKSIKPKGCLKKLFGI